MVLIVVAAILLGALAYSLLTRGNHASSRRTPSEQMVGQIGLRVPVDFEADLRPTREP